MFLIVWNSEFLQTVKCVGCSRFAINNQPFSPESRYVGCIDALSSTAYVDVGLTLILMFINDILNNALSRMGKYVDDTTAYSSIYKFEKVELAVDL